MHAHMSARNRLYASHFDHGIPVDDGRILRPHVSITIGDGNGGEIVISLNTSDQARALIDELLEVEAKLARHERTCQTITIAS